MRGISDKQVLHLPVTSLSIKQQDGPVIKNSALPSPFSDKNNNHLEI